MDENLEIQALNALTEQPTTYTISLEDKSMFPEDLQKEDTITIFIKPPTLETLSKCAIVFNQLPEDIRQSVTNNKNIDLIKIIKYDYLLAEIIAILAHGQKEIPDWYTKFLLKNLTPKELYMIYLESSMKMQNGFFLGCFQIAGENPMMMKKISLKGLTHSDS